EKELADFLRRVEQGKYIVIFAPRQTGKTTFFYQALNVLEKKPAYIPISLDFEIYSSAKPERFYQLIGRKIIQRIEERLKASGIPDCDTVSAWLNTQEMIDHFSFEQFFENLNSKLPNRKVFLIIDEFDGIPQEALKDFLYTLRQIYHEKKLNPSHNYIHSVGIVGVKSIAQLDFDHTISPFNIQDQFALPNFTVEQVAELYGQYTQEVGQPFATSVIELVHEKTAGQPFLVNRIGQILTEELEIPKKKEITIEHFQDAYAQILKEDNTHFQHVRRNIRRKDEFKIILNRIIFDEREVYFNINDSYISELATYGLVREDENELCIIDNPIYQEIIIKTFSPFINGIEDKYLPEYAEDFTDYLSKSGEIQMDGLLDNFRDFIARAGYKILEVPETPKRICRAIPSLGVP
ncbi:MAG: AAA-like domain-containing protein, partial [Candidatus Poribacteria bacterium]